VPSSRIRARAGYAPSIAASQWSSGSWIRAISRRSRWSRPRLSSIERLPVDLGPGRDAVAGPNQPADLRRQDVLLPRPAGERDPDPSFGRPVPVERSHVEGPDPEIPSVLDRRDGVVVADSREQPTDRGRAEAEPGHLEAGTAKGHALGWLEGH